LAQLLARYGIHLAAADSPARNPALLATEYNNEPEYASAVVFNSTLLPISTVTLAIFARSLVCTFEHRVLVVNAILFA
jgi:hypothetical protein